MIKLWSLTQIEIVSLWTPIHRLQLQSTPRIRIHTTPVSDYRCAWSWGMRLLKLSYRFKGCCAERETLPTGAMTRSWRPVIPVLRFQISSWRKVIPDLRLLALGAHRSCLQDRDFNHYPITFCFQKSFQFEFRIQFTDEKDSIWFDFAARHHFFSKKKFCKSQHNCK